MDRSKSPSMARFCLTAALALLTPVLSSEETHRFELGEGSAGEGGIASIPFGLTSTSDIQGLVAVVEWDGAVAEGNAWSLGAALAEADLVAHRVESDWAILGVVMDSDGKDREVIPAGDGIVVASLELRCLVGAAGQVASDVGFASDGSGHAAVEGGPALDNLVTVGGLSVGKDEGLELVSGTVTCLEVAPVSYRVLSATAEGGSRCGVVGVEMDNPGGDVEGYVVSIAHPAGLRLDSISIEGTAAEEFGADFSQSEIVDGGGTLGVVLDLVAPFDGNVIPAGEGRLIARYSYCCDTAPAEETVYEIVFQDGLGDPAKENNAVIGGRSIVPRVTGGTFTCPAAGAGEVCDNASDDDGDGLVDCDDPDCAGDPSCQGPAPGPQVVTCGSDQLAEDGLPFTVGGTVGGDVSVSFWYKSPEDHVAGAGQTDQVQGLSIAVCFPCELSARESSFDVTDTIVEAVGVEFISVQADNDPDDGDGCELIIGMLADSLPPFDGHTLPPTDAFLRLGDLTFDVADEGSLCGRCLPIEFCDGINGRGLVPIRNLASVNNHAVPLQLVTCEVCLKDRPRFFRGDCNYSFQGALSVDIADAAASVAYLFGRADWKFAPPCLDACDCNDDGRVDLADTMCTLGFLFQFGPFPPDPGPGFEPGGRATAAGEDPTEDDLDCASGGRCAG